MPPARAGSGTSFHKELPVMKNPCHPRRGFTLVELLVTIAILVALALLSFVAFTRMRAAGDRAAAVTVLRQLQLANFSYANEHNGKYVPISSRDENNNRVNDWHENSTFLGYLCGNLSDLDEVTPTKDVPISVLDPVVVRAKQRLWQRLFASYGYNEVDMPGSGPNSDKCFRVNQVVNPARTAAFVTATDWIAKYSGRLLWEQSPVEGKSTDGKLAFRHGGRAIVTYYDGSSGFVTPKDIKRFDALGGAKNPFWKADQP